MFNLRDWGADIWERSSRPIRVLIALGAIAAAASLPLLGGLWICSGFSSCNIRNYGFGIEHSNW